MIRRQQSMRFLGGYYAFPGGKVDPEDGAPDILDRCRGITEAEAGRLLPSENGVPGPIASGHPDDAARIDALREAHMAQREPLSALLAAHDWYLDVGPFRYLSHFITPPSSPIRFTARFFLAPVPAGQSPRHFREEASESFWVAPGEGFRRHRSGEWAMAEPADSGLGYLAQFDSLGAIWDAHEDRQHKLHGIFHRAAMAAVDIRANR